MLGTILIVILILMLLGAMPTWGHSRNWGYGPSGGLGLIVLILVVLVLSGRISLARLHVVSKPILPDPAGTGRWLEMRVFEKVKC